jgi:hypothetical protein
MRLIHTGFITYQRIEVSRERIIDIIIEPAGLMRILMRLAELAYGP